MRITQDSIQNAAGCLGAMPSRAGMAILACKLEMENLKAGGKIFVIDKGESMRTLCLQHDAISEDMRRRKVRFLPVQVTRRIVASLTVSLFK